MKKVMILTGLLFAGFSVATADVYDDAITQIMDNNATMKALRYEIVSQLTGMQMDNNLPETEIEFENVWASRGGEKKWNIGISQSFDFPGAYVARKRETDSHREALELKYRAELYNIMNDACELLIDIAYCNKAIELETAIVDDLKSIGEMLSKSYRGGEATVLEVNRSKIELANNMVKLQELQERKRSSVNKLAVLGYDVSESEEIMYPLAELGPLEDYYEQVEKDPFVAYYQQLKRAEALGERSRKMEMLPGIKVGFVHEYEDGTSFNGFSVGVTLPFFSNRGRAKQAKALKAQADWNERAARVERQSIIDVAYNTAVANKQLIDVLSPVFYNNNHTGLLLKAYDGGQMSAIDYLRELTYFRESEWDFLQVEYNYHIALSTLNIFQRLLN